MKFNIDAEDLQCENFSNFKSLIVPKSHFEGKENGLYFITRKNHLNGQTVWDEIPPVKVILTKENKNDKGYKSSNSNNALTIVLWVIGVITAIPRVIHHSI